jgi:hypothetical protein
VETDLGALGCGPVKWANFKFVSNGYQTREITFACFCLLPRGTEFFTDEEYAFRLLSAGLYFHQF